MIIQYNGLVTYQKGLELQSQAVGYVERTGRPVCLGLEHYPVITLGKRASNDEMLFAATELKEKGFEIAETDRGGQATLHTPGQLVVYPILPLRAYQISVRDYVAILENSTMSWLQSLKIQSQRREGAGVFTQSGKIAFIGIRVEKGISRHGISINVSNDLDAFSCIQSCGMRGRPLDSLENRQVHITPDEAFKSWVDYFIHDLIELRSRELNSQAH